MNASGPLKIHRLPSMWISRKTSRKSALRWSVTPESDRARRGAARARRRARAAAPRAPPSSARGRPPESWAPPPPSSAERVSATMWRNSRYQKYGSKPPGRCPGQAPRCVAALVCWSASGLSGMLGRRARLEQAQARSGAFETEYAATCARTTSGAGSSHGRSQWPNFVDAIHGFAFDRVGQGEKLCAGGGGTGRLGVDEPRRSAPRSGWPATPRSNARSARRAARARARGRGGPPAADGGPPPLVPPSASSRPRSATASVAARAAARARAGAQAARADRDRLAAGAAAARRRPSGRARGCCGPVARALAGAARARRAARGLCRAPRRALPASSGSPTARPILPRPLRVGGRAATASGTSRCSTACARPTTRGPTSGRCRARPRPTTGLPRER